MKHLLITLFVCLRKGGKEGVREGGLGGGRMNSCERCEWPDCMQESGTACGSPTWEAEALTPGGQRPRLLEGRGPDS